MYFVGGAVGFFCDDIKRLPEDMKALHPTVMPAVPRLLNRIYDKVMTEISGSFIKMVLFSMAMSAKESEIRR
jgi:long-chain acyl-CoA synthetase